MNLVNLFNYRRKGLKIGFTASTFDLFHAGHIVMLADAKSHCDFLIVGLQTNPQNDRHEKNEPVQSIFERYVQVASCEFVDMIIPFDSEQDLEDLLLTLMPDVRLVGEEYKDKEHTGKNIEGIEIIYNKRRHSFSSTDLRNRVIKNHKS
jgi:glycerol-3-phosphate cytidylyltransferase